VPPGSESLFGNVRRLIAWVLDPKIKDKFGNVSPRAGNGSPGNLRFLYALRLINRPLCVPGVLGGWVENLWVGELPPRLGSSLSARLLPRADEIEGRPEKPSQCRKDGESRKWGAGTCPADRVCGELPLGDDGHQAKAGCARTERDLALKKGRINRVDVCGISVISVLMKLRSCATEVANDALANGRSRRFASAKLRVYQLLNVASMRIKRNFRTTESSRAIWGLT